MWNLSRKGAAEKLKMLLIKKQLPTRRMRASEGISSCTFPNRRSYNYANVTISLQNRSPGLCYFSTKAKDPFARRPNKVCDPYGQGGKPLSSSDAKQQLSILEPGWKLVVDNDGTIMEKTEFKESKLGEVIPKAVQKEFYHENYLDASRFVSIIASVAHMNNHYPSISIERRLMKQEKAWRVVSTVTCSTETLGGLSFNDFHIAMLIDVEVSREATQKLLLDESDSYKKHV